MSESVSSPKGGPALVGAALLSVVMGTYYAWSVFVPALEHEFGWTRKQTSLVTTIDVVMLAITFMLAGFLQKRFGPRLITAIGGFLFSLGLFLSSFTHSLSWLYLTWGLLVGAGIGFGYAAPITVGANWFPNHRGLVNGFAYAVFAAGSGIFGPIGGTLTEHIGWRATFQVFAAFFFVFSMVGAWLLKDPPEGHVAPGKSAHSGHHYRHKGDTPTSEMLRQPVFVALWICFALGAAAGLMVISQLVPFARQAGLDARTAAFALTIGAVGSALGRILSGWLSDHLGRLQTLRTIILISMIATPALYVFREEVVVFDVLLFLVYYCYGTQLSVYTALSGDFWGTKYLGSNFGVLLLAWGGAGVIGPLLGSNVFVRTGSYQYAFFGAGALAAVALLILSVVRAPRPKVLEPAVTAAA